MFRSHFDKEDAVSILKSDHEKVKELFDDFENADSLREKREIAAEAIIELKIHTEIEEKIFYPVLRGKVDEAVMNEADEEHHVAKLIIAELDQMDGSEDHWEAKVTVLAENVRHHIEEEEGEMFVQARDEEIDFESLGQRLLATKRELERNGVPDSDEDRLMARNPEADSPAKNARLAFGKASPRRSSNKTARTGGMMRRRRG